MDDKKTLIIGIAALVVGLLLLLVPAIGKAAGTVLAGVVALLVLLAGVLFVIMGVAQVREDRAARTRDREETERQAAMAAKPA